MWRQISAPGGGPLIGAEPREFPPAELMSGTSWFEELDDTFHRRQTDTPAPELSARCIEVCSCGTR